MRKGIVLLLIAGFVASPLSAKTPDSSNLQHYADSLMHVCIELNQTNERLKQEKDTIIAQIRAEYEADINRYHTHINWNIGIIGLLFTGVLAGAGFLANKEVSVKLRKTRKQVIAMNKAMREYSKLSETFDEQIKKNEQIVKEINDSKARIDEVEKSVKIIQEQIGKSAEAARKYEEKTSANALLVQAFHEKNLDKKIDYYKKAIGLNKNFVEAYFNRGMAYLKKGDIEKAITDFKTVISINPNFSDAYDGLERAYSAKNDLVNSMKYRIEAEKISQKLNKGRNNGDDTSNSGKDSGSDLLMEQKVSDRVGVSGNRGDRPHPAIFDLPD